MYKRLPAPITDSATAKQKPVHNICVSSHHSLSSWHGECNTCSVLWFPDRDSNEAQYLRVALDMIDEFQDRFSCRGSAGPGDHGSNSGRKAAVKLRVDHRVKNTRGGYCPKVGRERERKNLSLSPCQRPCPGLYLYHEPTPPGVSPKKLS